VLIDLIGSVHSGSGIVRVFACEKAESWDLVRGADVRLFLYWEFGGNG